MRPESPAKPSRRPSLAERLRLEWLRTGELPVYLALFALPLLSIGLLLLAPPSHERTVLVLRLGEINIGLEFVALMYVLTGGHTWLSALRRGLRWLLQHRRA
jgi:hypothetical protein